MADDAFEKLLIEEPRYSRLAYAFVSETLQVAQMMSVTNQKDIPASGNMAGKTSDVKRRGKSEPLEPQHVTGHAVCLAARSLALERFGLLARRVLGEWGIRSTSDLGEIVYHLIRIGLMGKTDDDRREDFDDVFDFDTELLQPFDFSHLSADAPVGTTESANGPSVPHGSDEI